MKQTLMTAIALASLLGISTANAGQKATAAAAEQTPATTAETTAAKPAAGGGATGEAAKAAEPQDILVVVNQSGCLNCHGVITPAKAPEGVKLPIAPPYVKVAERYRDKPDMRANLLKVIKNGSNPYTSHWRDMVSGVAMPPMVTVSDADAERLVDWVLSLTEESAMKAEAAIAEMNKPKEVTK